jgi:hypothetical protein
LGALNRSTIASIASEFSFWCPNWRRVFSILPKGSGSHKVIISLNLIALLSLLLG